MLYDPYVHNPVPNAPKIPKLDEDMYEHIKNYLIDEFKWILPNKANEPVDSVTEAAKLTDLFVEEITATDYIGDDKKEGLISFREHIDTSKRRQKTLAYIMFVVWYRY